MRHKVRDEYYCGVDVQCIMRAVPRLNWEAVYYFKEFVVQRHTIHRCKDIEGRPAPWTENSVLQSYKFTNVRREHDRQTKYLIKNITSNDDLSLRDKIVNCFLFRAWNNWDTMEFFGFPYDEKELCSPDFKDRMRIKYNYYRDHFPRAFEAHKWWSNAFIQGGCKSAWRNPDMSTVSRKGDIEKEIPLRPFHIGLWLRQNDTVTRLIQSKNQQEAFNIIKEIKGYNDFLAYQVFVDLTYIKEFPFSENEFVVAGPGCRRGLDLIFKDKDGMNYEECIFWLRNAINKDGDLFNCDSIQNWEIANDKACSYYSKELFSDLSEYDRRMNVMSIENCMCELSKYYKAVKGTGRPRNHYKPYRGEES